MIMNGPHVNIVQRQGLGGILGGVGSIVSDAGSGLTSVVGGAGSDLTSDLGDITSAVLPTKSIPTATSTTPISTSTTHSSSSSSTSSSTSSTQSSTVTPSSSASVFVSTSDGVKQTITAFVTSSASPSPSSNSTNSSSGFLHNKPLEGFVFALCGIVGIVVVFVIATFALRRSRRKKMINEALSYEPTTTHGYRDDMERGLTRHSYSSIGSAGSGPPTGPPLTAYPAYGYEREYPAYAPRSPNPAYDATRAYGPYGGAAYDMNQVPQMGPTIVLPSQVHSQPVSRAPVPAMPPDSAAAAARI